MTSRCLPVSPLTLITFSPSQRRTKMLPWLIESRYQL
ncbi:hypothetical protein E2C01_053521 [Portunus trituberculatus]|uniref:Uncharacterized protein n=1 Tax=Portunus trituberculatus TaxID=210409 RepID=A0A5B7GHC3_PORTR|nr:hypothetical protein [Portunus trituberculatus]